MAQVVVEMSGDEAKLFRSYQKIIDQAAKLDQKHKELKKSSADAGQQAEQSFGGQAAAAIGKYAAGMMTLATATRVFGEAMAFNKANTDAAIQSVEKLIATRSQLQQVSEGAGGGDRQQMENFANQLSMRGISRAAAQDLVFSARSEKFTGSEDEVARLIGANYMSASDARTFAGQVPGIFDYKVSPIEGIAGAAYGAKTSRLNAAEYASMLPKAAAAAELAGGTPAEAFALAAMLPRKNERGAEYAATFAGQLAMGKGSKQFAGKGVMGMVDVLGGMSEAQRRELLGTGKEANLVYQWLSGPLGAEVRAATADASLAMSDIGGFIAGIEGTAFDPTTPQGQIMIGRRASIVASNRLETAQENRRAAGGLSRQAARQRAAARWEEQGLNPGDAYFRDKAAGMAERMGLPPTAIEFIGSPATAQSVADILIQIERNTREQQGAARSQAAANQQVE
jgi:hypothetical protein